MPPTILVLNWWLLLIKKKIGFGVGSLMTEFLSLCTDKINKENENVNNDKIIEQSNDSSMNTVMSIWKL